MENCKKKILVFLISWQKIDPAIYFIKTFNKIETKKNIEYLILKNYNDNYSTKGNIKNLDYVSENKSMRIMSKVNLSNVMNQNDIKGKIFYLERNYGYTGASNLALNYCKENKIEYALSVNADIIYRKSILDKLLEQMEKYDLTIIAPSTFESNPKSGNLEFLDNGHMISPITCSNSNFFFSNKERLISNRLYEVDAVTGCFFLINLRNLGEIIYRQEIFAYTDEIDFMLRLNKNNKKVAIERSLLLEHKGGGDVGRTNPFRTYLIFRNIVYLGYMHFPKFFIFSFMVNSLRLLIFIFNPRININNRYYAVLGYINGLKEILKKFFDFKK